MMNKVRTYVAKSETWWRALLNTASGYEPKTTFFADLSIADCFGENGVRDTYNRVIQEWGNNIEYMTEFVLCLNHKIWQLYEVNEPLARIYDELWRKASRFVEENKNFSKEDLSYYFQVID